MADNKEQKKITKLTPEQEAKMKDYRARGIDKGLNTEQIKDDEITTIVLNVYEHILKKEKVPVKIYGSPKSAWQAVIEHTGLTDKDYIHPYLDGHLSSYYFAFYDYMHEVLGIEFDCMDNYKILRETQKLGNIYPFDDIAIVSRNPVEIHMKDERLHNEKGPAVRYEDDFRVYALNGVRVPKWLVETPWNKIDAAEFAKIDNAEVRREFVRKVGIERITTQLGAIVIDKEGDYELIEVDLKGTTGKHPYLKMLNPSIGTWHMECVDKACKTVKDALQWRNQSMLEPEVLT